MKAKYDLREGKVRCRCVLRKWKFCETIRDLAGGRVTPGLLKCPEKRESEEVREKERMKMKGGASPLLSMGFTITTKKVSRVNHSITDGVMRKGNVRKRKFSDLKVSKSKISNSNVCDLRRFMKPRRQISENL